MKDETPEDCWRKAQERGHGKLKLCEGKFNFDTVDFGGIFDED